LPPPGTTHAFQKLKSLPEKCFALMMQGLSKLEVDGQLSALKERIEAAERAFTLSAASSAPSTSTLNETRAYDTTAGDHVSYSPAPVLHATKVEVGDEAPQPPHQGSLCMPNVTHPALSCSSFSTESAAAVTRGGEGGEVKVAQAATAATSATAVASSPSSTNQQLDLESATTTADSEVTQLKQQLQRSEEAMKHEATQLRARIAELEKGAASDASELQQLNTALQQRTTQFELAKTEYMDELLQLRSERSELQSRLSGALSHAAQLEEASAILRRDKESSERELHSHTQEVSALKKQHQTSLEEGKLQTTELIKELEQVRAQHVAREKEQGEKLDMMRSQHQALLQQLNAQVAESQTEAKALRMQRDHIQEQLNQSQKELLTTRQQLLEAARDAERLAMAHKQQTDTDKAMTAKLEQLKEEANASAKSVAALRANLEQQAASQQAHAERERQWQESNQQLEMDRNTERNSRVQLSKEIQEKAAEILQLRGLVKREQERCHELQRLLAALQPAQPHPHPQPPMMKSEPPPPESSYCAPPQRTQASLCAPHENNSNKIAGEEGYRPSPLSPQQQHQHATLAPQQRSPPPLILPPLPPHSLPQPPPLQLTPLLYLVKS
jgi:chromosome segregation ATPase